MFKTEYFEYFAKVFPKYKQFFSNTLPVYFSEHFEIWTPYTGTIISFTCKTNFS